MFFIKSQKKTTKKQQIKNNKIKAENKLRDVMQFRKVIDIVILEENRTEMLLF